MKIKTQAVDDKVISTLSINDFPKKVLIKALYWYSDRFVVNVQKLEDEYIVELFPKKGTDTPLTEVAEKLNQDFVDFKLRDIIYQETHTIRELLIAKAFSNGEYDEEPPGEMNDPIGINFFE